MKPNVWQHIVVTRSAATNTIAFYVNGAAKATGIIPVSAAQGGSPISIGRAKTGNRYVNGRLDEVAMYPTVLTPAQVAAHYVMGASTGIEIILSLSATDPDGDPVVFSATGLPPDLPLHSQTGRISGVLSPASVGTHEVTVTVTDTTSASSQTFAWTVEE